MLLNLLYFEGEKCKRGVWGACVFTPGFAPITLAVMHHISGSSSMTPHLVFNGISGNNCDVEHICAGEDR